MQMKQVEEKRNKSPNGEGSVRWKTDNLLEGRAMLNGKTIYIYLKAKGKNPKSLTEKEKEKAVKEAKKNLEKAINEAETSGVVPNHLTLQDLMAEWLEQKYEDNDIRIKTYGDYVSLINTHIRNSGIGKTEIQKLTVKQLERFFSDKKKNGRIPKKVKEKKEENKVKEKTNVDMSLSLATIRKMRTLTREALNYGMKHDYLTRNVALLVKLPKEEEKLEIPGEEEIEDENWGVTEYMALSPAERVAFLKQARQTSIRSSINITLLVMLYAGMRVGEALALKWRNVDLSKGIVHVRRNLQRVKTPNQLQKTILVVGRPKTKAGNRDIPIPSFIVDELIKHKEKQQKEKEKWGAAYNDKDIVFSTEIGNYREPRNLSRAFYNISNKAGLSNVSLHSLRHTYATMLFEKKVPAKTVSVLLGHADITTTLNIYSDVFPEIKDQAIEVLPDYISDIIKSSFKEE